MRVTNHIPDRPLMRYHGGKFRLAPWIISHFPAHRVYVEPFGGAASVLFQKAPSVSEVYNDLDDEIVNVFRVLRDDHLCDRLVTALRLTPFARAEFATAWETSTDPVERARKTLVRAEMGFANNAATNPKGPKDTGFRADPKNAGSVTKVWDRLPGEIKTFTERLRCVKIESRPALTVLDHYDTAETLFYVDPPYVSGTRSSNGACYRHEMSDDDHAALLDKCKRLQGYAVISGYRSDLYDTELTDWHRVDKRTLGSARRGSSRRTESLWLSPNIPERLL